MHTEKARLSGLISIAMGIISFFLSAITGNNIFGAFGGFIGIVGALFFSFSAKCPECKATFFIAKRGEIVDKYDSCGTYF